MPMLVGLCHDFAKKLRIIEKLDWTNIEKYKLYSTPKLDKTDQIQVNYEKGEFLYHWTQNYAYGEIHFKHQV